MFDLAVKHAFILSGGLPCMGINISFADNHDGTFLDFIVFRLVFV